MTQAANLTGHFLVATEVLDDSWFSKAVIFILSHSPENGAYGVVVNRISHIPAREVFSKLTVHKDQILPIFLGGPVEEQWVQILQLTVEKPQENVENTEKKADLEFSIHLMTQDDDLNYEQVLSQDVRIFMGYSGWTQGQLEKELADGLWDVHLFSPYEVLSEQPEDLCLSASEFVLKYRDLPI